MPQSQAGFFGPVDCSPSFIPTMEKPMVEMSVEPLVVSPKTACVMLDIGPTKLWGLINAGELESFLDGARRKITTRSIKARYLDPSLAGRNPRLRVQGWNLEGGKGSVQNIR